jgi:hypothetical protein
MLNPSHADPAAIASNTRFGTSSRVAPKTPVASKKRAQQISTHPIFRANLQHNLGIEQTFSGAVRADMDGLSGCAGNRTILAYSARLSGSFCFK